jgi:hypothetical protein
VVVVGIAAESMAWNVGGKPERLGGRNGGKGSSLLDSEAEVLVGVEEGVPWQHLHERNVMQPDCSLIESLRILSGRKCTGTQEQPRVTCGRHTTGTCRVLARAPVPPLGLPRVDALNGHRPSPG